MYSYLFISKAITFLAALALTWTACGLVGKPGVWWRAFAFSFTPALGAAFFATGFLANPSPATGDLAGGLLFEMVNLTMFCAAFVRAYDWLASVDDHTVQKTILVLLAFELGFFSMIVTSSGFGLFSDGAKNDYLATNPFLKYATYCLALLTRVQSGLLAQQLTRQRFGKLAFFVIIFQAAASIASGSKGAFFLWLLSIFALVDYRQARLPKKIIFGIGVTVSAALGTTAYVVSGFLGITVLDFFDLAFNRIFLTNDARAIAFDIRSGLSAEHGPMVEAFRSYARLFAMYAQDPPLGVHLYDSYFGPSGGNGANASLMAFAVYYAPSGYAFVYAAGAALISMGLFYIFLAIAAGMRSPMARYITWSVALTTLILWTQDVLAFQLSMLLAVPVLGITWLLSSPRRSLHLS